MGTGWRSGTSLAFVAIALTTVGCGGSGGPKVGDCISASHGIYGLGASSEPRASVVKCGSSHAAAKLVSKMGQPVIACINIDPGTENDYNVSVDGQDFCARPK